MARRIRKDELAAVQAEVALLEDKLREFVERPVADLIPKPPDIVAMRGTSWTKAARRLPAAPAPPIVSGPPGEELVLGRPSFEGPGTGRPTPASHASIGDAVTWLGLEATVVDGPTPGRFYRLRLGDGTVVLAPHDELVRRTA